MKTIIYLFISVLLLVSPLAHAQIEQVRSGVSNGAEWGSSGGYTTYGVAGQYVRATPIAGGTYTGQVGYLFGQLDPNANNLPPVAIEPSVVMDYELGSMLILEGFDPEGDDIEFVVSTSPKFGSLSLIDPNIGNEFIFTPSATLDFGVVYQDTVIFQIDEVNGNLSSGLAKVAFKFGIEDAPHEVIGLSKSANAFTVSIMDDIFNATYALDINYYDLTDPLNATFVNINNSSVDQNNWTISGSNASVDFVVDETAHSYLFEEAQVLVTVLVTTENGYSSFESYIIENSAGSRTLVSADGEYFVIGSEVSVPENKSVFVKLIAVDFAGFDESGASYELTSNPSLGSLTAITLVESTTNTRVWEAEYTSTEQVGGNDSFDFRVFNTFRNTYESGTVAIEIVEENDRPVFSAVADLQINEAETKAVTLSYSDPDNALTVSAESSDANVVISVVDGNLSVVAADDFSGTATISVWVEEVGTTEKYLILKSFTVEVLPVNDAPVLSTIANQSDDEDVAIHVNLQASDADSEFQLFTYYTNIDNPALANVEVSGNTLSIIPKENQFGVAQITVIADDGSGESNALSNSITFNVEFISVNDDPEVVQLIPDQVLVKNFPDYTIDMGQFFEDAETATGALTFGATTSTGVAITFVNNIATVSLTTDFTGTETLTITATDEGALAVSTDVNFDVKLADGTVTVNTAIVAQNHLEDFGSTVIDLSSVFVEAGQVSPAFTYNVIGNTLVDATIDDGAQTLTLQSRSNLNGTETLTLVGTGVIASGYTSFVLTVSAVNDAPVITLIESQKVNEDGTLTNLIIEVTDVEGDALTSLDVTSSDQSILQDASISHTISGQFYFVTLNPESDQNGSINLTATATASGVEDAVQIFGLQVIAVNDLPTVDYAAVNATASEDAALSIDISQLFADVDGDVLTFDVVNKPDWLALTGSVLSGTPTNEDVGAVSLSIAASDVGGEVIATFDFEIVNVNDTPQRIQQSGSRDIWAGISFSYSLPEGNFVDVDLADQLTYAVEQKPTWLTNTNGDLSGIPALADLGSDIVVFKATDLLGEFVRDTLYLNVQELTYSAVVSFAKNPNCDGVGSSVTASGAYDYNWYDDSNGLLQEGGATYESTGTQVLVVKGVDGQGTFTSESFNTSVDVLALPDANITESGDDLIASIGDSYTYVWYVNDQSIDGAMSSTYTPTADGQYKVTVTSADGCMATSAVVDISILGLDQWNDRLVMYPVPAREQLTILLNQQINYSHFSVINLNGQELQVPQITTDRDVVFDLARLQSGIYMIKIMAEGKVLNFKFVKD